MMRMMVMTVGQKASLAKHGQFRLEPAEKKREIPPLENHENPNLFEFLL